MKKSLFFIAVAIALAGCATTGTNGAVLIGPDMYMIGGQGNFFDLAGSTTKARFYKEAGDFCASKGRQILPISSTAKDAGSGQYATAEVQFYCLLPSDPRLTK